MSTTKRWLVLAIAVAMLMGLTMTATTAAPAWTCDDKPDHPSCSTTTTTEPDPTPSGEACAPDETGVITLVPGPGFTSFECLWTPENDGSPTGTVTVEATAGSISGPVIFVLDASPGDICVVQQEWDAPPYTASFDLDYGELPDDTAWDPDDLYPDYERYENHTYWSFEGPNWCYPQDQILGMRDDLNGVPLHLRVNFRAKNNTTVQITLSPSQSDSVVPGSPD